MITIMRKVEINLSIKAIKAVLNLKVAVVCTVLPSLRTCLRKAIYLLNFLVHKFCRALNFHQSLESEADPRVQKRQSLDYHERSKKATNLCHS